MKIFINGLSCSGKSTLSVKLAEQLNYKIIHTDDYYIDGYEGNWDEPQAFQINKLIEDINSQNDLVIEGIMSFYCVTLISNKEKIKLIYIDQTIEKCFERRSKRKQALCCEHEYFQTIVIPGYQKYCVNLFNELKEIVEYEIIDMKSD
ncbi:nicotinamide_riboside kinase 2 [Hexamita inflata]|uniref:Nicotinamide_riboside kinase 2 n=1 Tax=Hexamita inflata TaxID=28002 RepID=A0ABP1HKX2_9EUKA